MSNYIIDGTHRNLKLSGDFIVSKSAFIPASIINTMHKIIAPSYMYQGSSNNRDECNDNHYYITTNDEGYICVTPLYHQTTFIEFAGEYISFKSI